SAQRSSLRARRPPVSGSPAKIVESLGPSKRPPVRVTINGYTYRSTVASFGGVFMIGISAEVREQARFAAGDEVEVNLELDTEVRAVSVLADFAVARRRAAVGGRSFDTLSDSDRRRLVVVHRAVKRA